MKKEIYRLTLGVLVSGFLVLGCGPGGKDSGSGTSDSGDASDPENIDITKAISDGKVTGYDSTDPINDQYLVVVNYLRSLSVKCDDSTAIQGPSGSDVIWNDQLAAAAKEHSDDMKKSVHYDHVGSGTVNDITAVALHPGTGSTFVERIDSNGYVGTMKAENIAYSTANYELSSDYWIKIMESWMTSKHEHCSNIMNPKLEDFGMHESRAAVDGSGNYLRYWTQNFGRK